MTGATRGRRRLELRGASSLDWPSLHGMWSAGEGAKPNPPARGYQLPLWWL